MGKCVVCLEREAGGLLCCVCSDSFYRHTAKRDTTLDDLEWAANRARYFERKRSREREATHG